MTALLRLQNTKKKCCLKCKCVLAFQHAFANTQSGVGLIQLWLESGVICCCLLWGPGQVHHRKLAWGCTKECVQAVIWMQTCCQNETEEILLIEWTYFRR